jgi:TolA-binding protein
MKTQLSGRYERKFKSILDELEDEPDIEYTNNDLKILWTYMKLQGSAIITEDNLIIKFIKKSKNNISNNSNSSAINEGDRARLELLKSMSTIRKKISSLENEIKECKHKAVKHKLNNDHNSALFECKILRLKTDHNKRLYTSLCTLEMAINNIEKVDMNRTMLNAYVIATKGLKAAQENLSIETLEDAIDAFNEQVNEVQQYEDMIADAVGVNQYDEELEKELDALISGNTDEGITTTPIKNNINDITLPAVPNHPILIHNNSNQKSLIESSSEKQLSESL